MMNSLRSTLRFETAIAHERLDQALCVYDLTTQRGLAQYLKVHLLACLHLNQLTTDEGFRCEIATKISSIQADLGVLNTTLSSHKLPTSNAYQHPVGLTYVIAGSSLGGKLLFNDWAKTIDPVVKKAGKFMHSAKITDSWKKFLTYIDKNDFSSEEIEKIVSSANYCFGVFEYAHQAIAQE